jgi:DNA gyrase/topoisomerase IV subunit A
LFPCPTPGDNQASASGTFYGKSGTGPGAVDQTWDENLHIVFATQSGIVKKSNLSDYANVRRGGIIAIQIEEGDRLIDAEVNEWQDADASECAGAALSHRSLWPRRMHRF